MISAVIKETSRGGGGGGGFYGCSPTHYQMFRGHSSLCTQSCRHPEKFLCEKKQKKANTFMWTDSEVLIVRHCKVSVKRGRNNNIRSNTDD